VIVHVGAPAEDEAVWLARHAADQGANAISSLPPYVQGYSFEEIAESWKKKAGAVQRFYARAWKRFCEIAKDEDG
jgi:dihydrodipicolinate synthase/N-acetylneuraminate lyase